MKQEVKEVDNYGFSLCEIFRHKKDGMKYLHMHYYNEQTLEHSNIVHSFPSFGMIRDMFNEYTTAKKLEEMDIIEVYAHQLLVKFGFYKDLEGNSDLFYMVEDIPESLIKNDMAVKELLSYLQVNKNLSVNVFKDIKARRTKIEKREKHLEEISQEASKEYEKIQEEFGL